MWVERVEFGFYLLFPSCLCLQEQFSVAFAALKEHTDTALMHVEEHATNALPAIEHSPVEPTLQNQAVISRMMSGELR